MSRRIGYYTVFPSQGPAIFWLSLQKLQRQHCGPGRGSGKEHETGQKGAGHNFWKNDIAQGHAAAAAESLQSCLTLCDPRDGSPPGSPVPGILQAGTLAWIAMSFSNAWNWKMKVKSLNHVWPSGTPCTAACQAPPSMGFSRQEYWSGVPLPSPVVS